jgi:predicted TIM-barrel fold metal-dependent hydrolase
MSGVFNSNGDGLERRWNPSPLRRPLPSGAWDCHCHVFGPLHLFPQSAARAYTAGTASPAELVAWHDVCGIENVVLVQPSIYGTDNDYLVAALAEIGASARGVAVLGKGASAQELRRLHAAGIRGARLNLKMETAMSGAVAATRLRAVADSIAQFGWHIEIYAALDAVVELAPVLQSLPCPVVVDHYAEASVSQGLGRLEQVLALLAGGNVYVKLSAPYKIGREPGYADVAPLAAAFVKANPRRVLWGSDWPHTGGWPGVPRNAAHVEPFHPIDDGQVLDAIQDWFPDAETQRLLFVENAGHLYGN